MTSDYPPNLSRLVNRRSATVSPSEYKPPKPVTQKSLRCVIRQQNAMAVITWKIETLVFWFVFSCDCDLMSTKLYLDIFCFESTQIQFNLKFAIVLFCFLFNASDAFKDKNIAFVQSFDYTRFDCCGINSVRQLDNPFKLIIINPSSLSDRCWPCKMIFSPSTSSEMSSRLYCFSGRETILIGLCTANLFWMCWKLVSRACSSEARAISLHRSCKNPNPGTASS